MKKFSYFSLLFFFAVGIESQIHITVGKNITIEGRFRKKKKNNLYENYMNADR